MATSSSCKSDVWKYFSKPVDKKVTCSLCVKNLSFCGGTSNLREHLVRHHGDIYKPLEKQNTLDCYHRRCSDLRTKSIDDLVLGVVFKDMRPLTIVEGEGMQCLLKFLEPEYRLPSRKHIGKLLKAKHEQRVALLRNKLVKDATAMTLTSDIWTSNANEGYCSLTCHFITSTWEMKSCVLQTKHFPERHTGQNIADCVEDVVKSFGIETSKVVGVVHDTCANAELAGSLMYESLNWISVQCAAHKLQLAVNEGLNLPNIARAVGAARKLVGHFKHSALATTQLKIRQERMEISQMNLIQDCATRWNSTFYMLQRLLANRWPVSAVLSDESVTKRQYRCLDLRTEYWQLFEELVKPLELLESATVFLCKEFNVSCSCVYPVIHGLLTNLKPDDEDIADVRRFKVVVSGALRIRWNFDDIDGTQVPALASVFDPRFKDLKFLSAEKKETVKEHLKLLMDELLEPVEDFTPTEEPPPRKKSALDMLFGDDSESEPDQATTLEIDQYFAEKTVPRDTEPLQWWRMNQHRFSKLAQLARRYLSVPATSAPSERLFSKAGNLVSKKRSSLKPKNVDAILFCNSNYKYLSM